MSVELLIGKPVRFGEMTGPFTVDKIIHDKGQFASQRVAVDKKTQDPMIKGIGFGIRADGQAYRAVGPRASPVSVAPLHLALPLGRSPYLVLITALNGL